MTPPRIASEKRGYLLAALVGLALVQASALAGAAFATRSVFDSLNGGTALPLWAIGLLAVSGFMLAVAKVGFHRLGEQLGQSYTRAIRLAQFEHASRMRRADLEQRRLGYVVLRFVGDLNALKAWPSRGLPLLIEAVIVLPAMIAVLFMLNSWFGTIAALFVAVSLAGFALGMRSLLAADRHLRRVRGRLAADMTERLPLAPDLAALGRRAREARGIETGSAELSDAAVGRATLSESLRTWPEAAAALAAAAMLFYGSREGLETGTIAAGLAALGLAVRPTRGLATVASRWSAFKAAHTKLVSLLARSVSFAERGREQLQPGPVALEVKNTTIPGYAPVSVQLAAGGRSALPQGAPAERLFQLIAGTGASEAGTVQINGLALDDVSPGSLRRAIARITDKPVALRGSLRRTIALAVRDRPTDEEIMAFLADPWLHGLLERLGGLQRRLPEAARSLSTSDRVALSVLQAAVRKPGLLLVDAAAEHVLPGLTQWLDHGDASILREVGSESGQSRRVERPAHI